MTTPSFPPLDAPWRLQEDNFTPPQRTPWGGTRILNVYKRALGLPAAQCVGEAWEVSLDKAFPSRLPDFAGLLLADAIAADPSATLGPVRAGFNVLVKLLDADTPLSVQVHPRDDYPGLAPGECGKPESWLIVDAKPGAGLYLGVRDGVSRERMQGALEQGEDVAQLLNFVPVKRGDVFEIEAGTVHAIGGGITLVEPQVVLPKLSGVTYRFWDWNRRYDAAGQPSAQGKPRELHMAHALAVSNFSLTGDAFVASVRRPGYSADTKGPARDTLHIDHPSFQAGSLTGSGTLRFATERARSLTVVEGEVQLGAVTMAAGTSWFLPAPLARQASLQLQQALCVWCEPR